MARRHIIFEDPPAGGPSSSKPAEQPLPVTSSLNPRLKSDHKQQPAVEPGSNESSTKSTRSAGQKTVAINKQKKRHSRSHGQNNNNNNKKDTVQHSDTPTQSAAAGETPVPLPPQPWHGALPFSQNLRHQILLPPTPSPPSPPPRPPSPSLFLLLPPPLPSPSSAAAAASVAAAASAPFPHTVKLHPSSSSRLPRVSELEIHNTVMSGHRTLEPKQNGMLNITVEDFIRHRDSVVTGLTTLIGNINDFNRAFIRDTNMMLGGDGGEGSYAITNFMQTTQSIFNPADNKGKKEKKKKEPRDPNLPKRPLTAYFLYQQNAKSIVQNDLPEGASSKEVADEMLRRWTSMSEEEKQKWKDRYKVDMVLYDKAMLAYNAEKDDKTAVQGREIDETPVNARTSVAAPAAAEASEDDSSDDDSESEESSPPTPPPPPPKQTAKPSKKANRKKESAPVAPAKSPSPSSQLTKETPVPAPEATEKKTGKDSKRKRATKEEAPAGEIAPPAAAEPPAKKSKKAAKPTANSAAPDAEELPTTTTPGPKEKKEKKDSKKKRKSDAA